MLSAGLHAFRVRIAREQGTGKSVRGVEGHSLVTLLGGEEEGL